MIPDVTMSPRFARALRAELVSHVREKLRPWWRRRAFLLGAGVFAATAAVGSGIAVAVSNVLPGGVETFSLSEPVGKTATGSGLIELGDPPAEATGVTLALTCDSPGTFHFDDGSKLTCTVGDEGSTVTVALPLTTPVSVTTDPDSAWTASAAYVISTTHPWAVNANGQTYGVVTSAGSPDLVAVVATNGKEGYVRSNELAEAAGDLDFRSPEAALEWQESVAGTTASLTVYLSDGTTEIGTFLIER